MQIESLIRFFSRCSTTGNLHASQWMWADVHNENRTPHQKAVSRRDLYDPNRIFSHNTASKSHGRRQPCRGFLSCLAGESLVLECFAVLNGRFLFAGTFRGRRNTGYISRTMNFLRTKRFFQNRANPLVSPPKGALLHIRGYSAGTPETAHKPRRSKWHRGPG